MHRQREEDKEKRKDRKPKGKDAHWQKGDFVLVARISHRKGEKISVRWRGPYKVTVPFSQWVYEVQELESSRKMRVHATRLKLFCERERGKESVLASLAQSQQDEWPVKKIEGFHKNATTGEWEAEVVWDTEEAEDERYFEPLSNIACDIPKMTLKAYWKGGHQHKDDLEKELKRWIPEGHWLKKERTPVARKRRASAPSVSTSTSKPRTTDESDTESTPTSDDESTPTSDRVRTPHRTKKRTPKSTDESTPENSCERTSESSRKKAPKPIIKKTPRREQSKVEVQIPALQPTHISHTTNNIEYSSDDEDVIYNNTPVEKDSPA
eukprot:GHVU01232307.1.p1 GENE.GHVU01232307.1~~GHVU01232307.1.p1  ORF type:complete len:324 (+),score=48.75 GHVU01232307.1:3-974(+)